MILTSDPGEEHFDVLAEGFHNNALFADNRSDKPGWRHVEAKVLRSYILERDEMTFDVRDLLAVSLLNDDLALRSGC